MAARLRRGVEVHDTLAVLAGYGSVAAVATTIVIIMLVVVSIYMRLMMRVSAHRDDVSIM